MKKLLLITATLLSVTTSIHAQTGISAAGTAPDASAMLDVIATDKGFLAPRIALLANNNSTLPIPSPAAGLLVYNTATAGSAPNNVTPGYYYWDGTVSLWQKVSAGNALGFIQNQNSADQTANWRITGTGQWGGATSKGSLSIDQGSSIELGGTGSPYIDIANAIGDDFDARIQLTGNDFLNIEGANVGIGSASPAHKLDVVGNGRFNSGAATYVYVGSGGGAYYADAANTVVHTPAGGSFYMANVGTDGTKVAQADGTMRVGGPSQTAANLYVYGNAGIGNTGPTEKLEVSGAIKMSGASATDNDSPALTLVSNDDFLYDAEYINHYAMGFHQFNDGAGLGWNTYASGYYGIDLFTGGAQRFRINNNGTVKINNLAGTGSRFVVADASGNLSATSSTTAGIVTGSGASPRVAYWNGANTLTSSGQFLYSGENLSVYDAESSVGEVRLGAAWNRPGVYSSSQLELFSGSSYITFGNANIEYMRLTAAGGLGIGTTAPQSLLHVMGKTNIHQSGASGGQNRFEGLEAATSANGRAQLVLSSAYSDLIIASSQANDNHGSTLTFASYNPGNAADYRKFVINQGNWGARFGYLDFGFADAGGRTNPHSNINGTDNVITLNGINKRLGVGIMSPAQTLDVAGKTRIRRGVNTMGANANEGQLEIANTGSGDAYISFHREGVWGAQFGLESDNWFTTKGWSPGGGAWNSMRLGNLDIRGVVTCVQGYCPPNNAIRMTPNFHFNTPAGNAMIVNWDNGGVGGGTQQFRVGNGSGTDQFYVRADGQFFGRHFADLDDAGYYINPNGFSQTHSVYANNWFRPQGNCGLYFESYGGGWWMTDATWIRNYNAKRVYLDGGLAVATTILSQYGANARIASNWDNANSGGIAVADDGGFYDFNDGWVQFRGSTGLNVITDNGSWDMIFGMCTTGGGCTYDKRVATGSNAWGLLGASGNAWYQAWSYSFNNASQRELKKDITPVKGSLGDLVMADLDKMTPYLYRYNEETDEWSDQNYAKYRTGLHMGLILDETPDYIQSQSYAGVDVYAVASLGVAASKYNREEIKQIKESIGLSEQAMSIQDFGSTQLNGREVYVSFDQDFSAKLGNTIPVVTVSCTNTYATLLVTEKSAKGFKVSSSSEENIEFDYIAMAKVKNTMVEEKEEISAATMSRIRVDQSSKDKVIQYWKDEPKREAERLEKAQREAVILQEQRAKEMGVQVGDPAREGAIVPTNSNLKTVETDVDALIKEAAKQVEKNAPLYSPNKDEIPK